MLKMEPIIYIEFSMVESIHKYKLALIPNEEDDRTFYALDDKIHFLYGGGTRY